MSKLPEKLRIFKARKQLKFKDIAIATGATVQTVKNWTVDERCPDKISLHFAKGLVDLCVKEGCAMDITLRDCGHK